MTTIIANASVRQIALGINVSRAAANLPQTAAGNIFTVSGGRILMVSLIGEVTTVIQTQANNTKIQSVPTTGSAVDLCAVLSITAFAVGVHLTLPAAAATALQSDTGTGGGVIAKQAAWLIPVGSIALNCAASNTGQIKWDLTYVPLDIGAQVVAA